MKSAKSALSSLLITTLLLHPFAAMADDCATGTTFDSTLNRCLTSEEAATVMNAATACNSDQACYKSVAEDALTKAVADGKVKEQIANASGLVNSSLKVAAIAVPFVTTVSMLATHSKCPATSAIIMTGAGIVAFAGDTLANSAHKKRLAAIKEEWDDILTNGTTTTEATEAQSQAFEMLAKSEDSMNKAAKLKAGIYGIAGAAFAAAAVIAAMEQMKPKPDRCSTTASFKKEEPFHPRELYSLMEIEKTDDLALIVATQNKKFVYASASVDEYEEHKSLFNGLGISRELVEAVKETSRTIYYNLIPIQEAHAVGPLTTILASPTTRMIMGGVLAAWSVTMAIHASNQATVSKNRAAYLRKMKDDFNDASSAIGCTTTQRADSATPTCYCYNEDGSRNSDRASSTVCTTLFTGIDTSTTASSYLTSTTSSCITTSGTEDSTCSCTTTGTCATTGTLSTVSGLDTSTLSLTNSALTNLDSVASGTTDAANVNTSASAANAVRLLNAAKTIASKSASGAAAVKSQSSLASQVASALQASAAQSGSQYSADSSSSLPKSTAEAVAALSKELTDAKAQNIKTANGDKGTATAPSSGEPAPVLDFGLQKGGGAETAVQVAEAMKKNYDYGTNDINNKSDESIFNILSSRYQQSGLRRLFDEKK